MKCKILFFGSLVAILLNATLLHAQREGLTKEQQKNFDGYMKERDKEVKESHDRYLAEKRSRESNPAGDNKAGSKNQNDKKVMGDKKAKSNGDYVTGAAKDCVLGVGKAILDRTNKSREAIAIDAARNCFEAAKKAYEERQKVIDNANKKAAPLKSKQTSNQNTSSQEVYTSRESNWD